MVITVYRNQDFRKQGGMKPREHAGIRRRSLRRDEDFDGAALRRLTWKAEPSLLSTEGALTAYGRYFADRPESRETVSLMGPLSEKPACGRKKAHINVVEKRGHIPEQAFAYREDGVVLTLSEVILEFVGVFGNGFDSVDPHGVFIWVQPDSSQL